MSFTVSSPYFLILRALFAEAGLAPSRSEARRLVGQGAVAVNDERVDDPQAEVTLAGGEIIRVGKRRFACIVIE